MSNFTKFSGVLVFAFLFQAGCSTHRETVTTETRNAPGGTTVQTTETRNIPSETTVQTTETRNVPAETTVQRTETTTSDASQETGVLSSTVNVIGEVVALPFRAVGALFRAIF